MALSLRGTAVSGTGAPDPTVTLPVGTATDDVVYVAFNTPGTSNIDQDLVMITTGYTELADLFQNDLSDTQLGVFRKIMGATPDSSAQCETTTTNGIAVCHVWTGVDLTTPEDATTTTAGATDDGTPQPPSIVTATANAIVLAIGGSSEADAVTNAPTGYSNLIDLQHTAMNVMISSKLVASPGTETPGRYADIAGTAADTWCAATVAIRPAAAAVVLIPRPTIINQAVQRAASW